MTNTRTKIWYLVAVKLDFCHILNLQKNATELVISDAPSN